MEAGLPSAVRKVLNLATAQIKKAVPCITFRDVGLKSKGNGLSSVEGGTAECNEVRI
jgi:hypothetical protein